MFFRCLLDSQASLFVPSLLAHVVRVQHVLFVEISEGVDAGMAALAIKLLLK